MKNFMTLCKYSRNCFYFLQINLVHETKKTLFTNIINNSSNKKVYKEKRLVGFSKEQLFDIVLQTENYAKFLPGCHRSETKDKFENKILVELEVGYPPLLENYISEVTFKRPNFVIAKSKNGKLFNNLITKWVFDDSNLNRQNSCIINFELEFEFKSQLFKQIGMPLFDTTAKNTLEAFLKRAEYIYGRPTKL